MIYLVLSYSPDELSVVRARSKEEAVKLAAHADKSPYVRVIPTEGLPEREFYTASARKIRLDEGA